MSVKLDVQMTPKAMYDFLLYHTYSHLSGLIGAIFGVVVLGLGIRAMAQGDYTAGMMFFFFAAVFLVMTPLTLKSKAKAQVKTTPMFQKPICYELTEEGITISQEDQQTEVKWGEFQKAVSTNRTLILYITRVRALVLPKADFGEQYTAAVQMISTHMPPAKVKIRQVR